MSVAASSLTRRPQERFKMQDGFFRYVGGKGGNSRKGDLARRILDELTRLAEELHGPWTFAEPFVGSGVIAANVVAGLRPNRVWLNDFDPAVAALHDVAIHHAAELCQAVNATPKPTKEAFTRLQRQYKRCDYPDDPIQIALGKLLIQQLGVSGRDRGMSNDQRWSHRSLITRVRRWEGLFAGKTNVTCRSFEKVITAHGRMLLYLDPPYPGKKGYQYDMTWNEHEQLADLLRATRHPWVLSYGNKKAIRKLYDWATIQEVDAEYCMDGQMRKTIELIITGSNGQKERKK